MFPTKLGIIVVALDMKGVHIRAPLSFSSILRNLLLPGLQVIRGTRELAHSLT